MKTYKNKINLTDLYKTITKQNMQYYIHYTDNQNCKSFGKYNGNISKLHQFIEKMLSKGCKNISVFNFDTWNTSDPKGLVLFDKNCAYWLNYNKRQNIKL